MLAMKWYWHVVLRWPENGAEHRMAMVAESEAEVRDVWRHYEVVSVRRGAQAARVRTVES